MPRVIPIAQDISQDIYNLLLAAGYVDMMPYVLTFFGRGKSHFLFKAYLDDDRHVCIQLFYIERGQLPVTCLDDVHQLQCTIKMVYIQQPVLSLLFYFFHTGFMYIRQREKITAKGII